MIMKTTQQINGLQRSKVDYSILLNLLKNSKTKFTNVFLDIKGEEFKSLGVKIVEPGWRKYYPFGFPQFWLLQHFRIYKVPLFFVY